MSSAISNFSDRTFGTYGKNKVSTFFGSGGLPFASPINQTAANKAADLLHKKPEDKGEKNAQVLAAEDEVRKAALRDRITGLFTNPDALKQFGTEEEDLSGALRGQYSDDLKRKYGEAERATRFGAANTGNIGGTTFADAQSKLSEENQRGGTQIEEAVRRAITGLRSSREDAKLKAIGLVNAGTGEEAVGSAVAGMKSAADAARAGSKEQLFTDLFQNLAYTKAASDSSDKNAAALAYLNRARGGSFFPTQSSSGRIIN